MCWVMPPASPGGDLGLADRVEQRGLAVVDVAHDRDHRRAVDQVLVGVGELRFLGLLVGGADDLDLAVVLVGDRPDRLVGERLGERRHLAHHHEFFDHLGRGEADRLAQLTHGGAGVDLGRLGLDRGLGTQRRLLEERATTATTTTARRALRRRAAHLVAAGGLRVDHDAAFFARCAAAPAPAPAPPPPPAGRTGLFDVPALLAGGLAGLRWRRRTHCRHPGERRISGPGAGRARRVCRRRGRCRGFRGRGRLSFRSGFGRRRLRFRRRLGGGTTPIGRTERPQGVGLLDARGRHFGFDPGGFQLGKDLFRADAVRFRDLMNPLLCH